jgi:uncharacterized lipoprotein YmbA
MKKILCLLVLLIGACSWRSPNSEFYMMGSQGLEPLSQKKVNAVVANVKVPDILDRAQMVVYEAKDNQVKIMEFDRWGEVLPNVLQSTVVNDLIAYLPNSYIKRTYFDSPSATYNINIEINSLRAYQAKEVILSAWWNIANAKGNVIARHQGVYTAKVDGGSVSDLVEAQTQAVHMLSKDIAEKLAKL